MKKKNERNNIYLQLLITGSPALAVLLLFIYSIYGVFLPSVKQAYYKDKRESAKNLVALVYSSLESRQQEVVSGVRTLSDAKKFAMQRIKAMRYGNEQKDYFWIMNSAPKLLMHPYLSNNSIDEVNDLSKPFRNGLFVEMKKAAMKKGGGFIDYKWQWKDNPTKIIKKTSYLVYYKPWDWIIGTGVYLDDMEKDLESLHDTVVIVGFLSAIIAACLSFLMAWKIFNATQVNLKIAQTLRERENDLRITLEAIGDAVVTTDAKGYIQRFNHSASVITGWSVEDAIGSRLHTVLRFKKDFAASYLDNFKDFTDELSSDLNDSPTKFILTDIHNHNHYIDQTFSYIYNKNNDIIGAVIVFRDITEKNIIQEKLQHSAKMDSIGKLAGGVAHDFNNMLAGIRGAAELIDCNLPASSALKKYVDIINEASIKAADLTNKLLAFARKSNTVTRNTDIHNCIKDAVDILEHSIDKRISINTEFHATNSIVAGDSTHLQNVFLNLGTNSRDALPSGGDITISTSNVILDENFCTESSFAIKPGEYIKVCVHDSGYGISPDLLKQIFEPFFTTKEVGKGTGLGLSAVYGTVTDHNGAITVTSDNNCGTSFYIFLPVIKDSRVSSAISQKRLKKGEGCILVIDDEPVMRKMAEALLESIGYSVIVASDGKEGALKYASNHENIKAVILDMIMPEMNGKDCFYKIISDYPEAKIIITSGFSQDASIEEMMRDGLAGFINKPYSRNELSCILNKVIKQKVN